MADIIHELRQLIEERHLLKHPFYQLWTQGDLRLDSIRDYSKQYFQHVLAFPTYVSAVHSNCSDLAARQVLLENLIEEERGEENHPELWMRFCEGLGLTRQEVLDAKPYPETWKLVSTFKDKTKNGSFSEGLACLYAYESQIPAISEAKIDGLRRHYGITEGSALSFFETHIKYDKLHAAAEEQILTKCLREDQERIKGSARSALNALWDMLSGVLRRNQAV